MSNVDKLNALKPEKKTGLTKEELVAIKAARDRGCSWRQIWEAGDWPQKTQASFQGAVYTSPDYPR